MGIKRWIGLIGYRLTGWDWCHRWYAANWVLKVFKPLPPDEAEKLREYW